MKKHSIYILAMLMTMMCGIFSSCSEFEPTGYTEMPGLPKAEGLTGSVANHEVTIAWTLPADNNVEGSLLMVDGNNNTAIKLDKTTTSYTFKGMPMGEEKLYTVKVLYADNLVSEGVTVGVEVPQETLADVTGLNSRLNGRTVTLTWGLPSAEGLTGIRVIRNGDTGSALTLEPTATSVVLEKQPMGQINEYTVQAIYDTYYASEGVTASVDIPTIESKVAFLLLAAKASDLPDDDERAAASWFATQKNAEFVSISDLATLDPDIYTVLWIMVDRMGLPIGWQNLPDGLALDSTIEALKAYSQAGGSLYLSNMATQLTAPLGFVPDNMAPSLFANGAGGTGTDVWCINQHLGWDFRNGSDQGYYDHTAHEIFKGLTMEDPNGYGYDCLPLIGPGQREDHNCMWDCNIYGRGNQADVIRNFEVITNSTVLATWGHVRDHCVAGLVDFQATPVHGRCVANGFAAYEWNQNSGANIYQKNIEKLTSNILDYLK